MTMSLINTNISLGDNNKNSTRYGRSVGLSSVLDRLTALNTTITTFPVHYIPQPTLSALNTGVTTTNAATLYIAGSPISGTNMSIAASYSLYIAAGASYFAGGVITANLTLTGAGSATASSSTLYIAPSSTIVRDANSYYFTYLNAPVVSGTTSGSASTLYISGAPTGIASGSSASTTYAINVATGATNFGGDLIVAGTISAANVGPAYPTTSNVRKSVTICQDVFGQTLKKWTIPFDRRVAIKTSDITINITGCPCYDQIYTFGQSAQLLLLAGGRITSYGNAGLLRSNDGVNWSNVPNINSVIFGNIVYGIGWNGYMWIGCGNSSNVLQYSFDGINWNACIYATSGRDFGSVRNAVWNGTMWVAIGFSGGGGTHIKYSYDGITWIETSGSPGSECLTVAWNGYIWIVGIYSANPNITYSYNGINWTSVAVTVFSTYCHCIGWNGTMWVAGGTGTTHSIAYCIGDPTVSGNWIGIGKTIFSNACSICLWNGTKWLLGGDGTNTIAYSNSGGIVSNWTVLGSPVTTTTIIGIWWTGSKWILGGSGTNNILAYTNDGDGWTSSVNGIIGSGSYGYFSIRAVTANSQRLHSIKFPRNAVVAVGSSTVLYSIDGGANWINSLSGTAIVSGLFGTCVAWNGQMWIFGGTAGKIAYSYDGINWSSMNSIFGAGTYRGLVWNGTMWLALGTGNGHTMAYSYDGFTWIGLGTGIFASEGRGAAWNGVMWVAAGVDASTAKVMYSYDGINWYLVNNGAGLFANYAFDVAWNGSMWIVAGGENVVGTGNRIIYSYDGLNWNVAVTGSTLFNTYVRGVAWNGNMWVATGLDSVTAAKRICYSYDGINWSQSDGTGATFNSDGSIVRWCGQRWIAVGKDTVTAANRILYSQNGIKWTASSGATITGLEGQNVAWTGGVGSVYIQHPMIALGSLGVGLHTIAYSPDGLQWRGLGAQIFSTAGYYAAWNGSIWIACGEGTNTLAWSQDGITWNGLGTSIFLTRCRGAAWNGSIWVAVGSGTNTIAWSTDGKSWTAVSAGLGGSLLTEGYAVAWNGSVWAAVGTNSPSNTNFIVSSTDGKTWIGRGKAGFTTGIYTIRWVSTNWIIGGQGGVTNQMIQYSSGTGLSGWTNPTTTPVLTNRCNSIAWNGTRLVAVGSGTNTIAYSDDNGGTWTVLGTSIFSSAGQGVAWNGRAFIAGGFGTNSLAYSGNGANWSAIPSNSSIFPVATGCFGFGTNPRIGATVVDSQMIIDKNGYGLSGKMDVVSSDPYYNAGYSNFSANFKYTEI